ncbi:MAG TPA: AAA family ATPase [bacterium]|nr:AAA family ATPase [bacterium]
MITKIVMNNVASYKSVATLETDKKINLIYGLNGTGKSTFSDFLYDMSNPKFSGCSVEGLSDGEVLVYNQQFIKDYFYEPDNLKGIFTLSKENKDAEERIKIAEKEKETLVKDKTSKTDLITAHNKELAQKKQEAELKTWEIKTDFAGGDRVLEYCLEGLKSQKDKLFDHLLSIPKPDKQPVKTADQLKKEVEAIQGNNAQKFDMLKEVKLDIQNIEKDQLFSKTIIGNENSSVAELIKKLGNSDWVKKGLDYLPKEINDKSEPCPFCQGQTINRMLIDNIRNYFDESYEKEVNELRKLSSEYEAGIKILPKKESYESNPFVLEKKAEFENYYNNMLNCISNNNIKISDKIKTPSQAVVLLSSDSVIDAFNLFIEDTNKKITEHNHKIDNKKTSLAEIKDVFWGIMRWNYDQTLISYQSYKTDIDKKTKVIEISIAEIDGKILRQGEIVVEQQKKTVNIEKAIASINEGLVDLGIDGFLIEKHSEALYKIVRAEQCDNTFQTLSEGEKMIISFLYFRELCKGKKSVTSQSNKKIVVIDDPISSLSHIYIFNVGQMIKNDFFNSTNIEQVFLLTHSLYFFYEMTDTNHERREKNQKLFRMLKNCNGSQLLEMKYDEIQNDYHSYWLVIKDNQQPSALIANCMRNIIEYFFNFIEKRDLNNVFQKPALQATKYQAFCRYINRESHSLGQNIFDYKEFNYDDFKEALSLVFKESGYEEHYKEMIK